MARSERYLVKGGYQFGTMESALKRWSVGAPSKKRPFTKQETRGSDEDRLAVKRKTQSEDMALSPLRGDFDAKQGEICRQLIMKFYGVQPTA